jgi:hypothetical protein
MAVGIDFVERGLPDALDLELTDDERSALVESLNDASLRLAKLASDVRAPASDEPDCVAVLEYRFEVSHPGPDSAAFAESAASALETALTTLGCIVDSWTVGASRLA